MSPQELLEAYAAMTNHEQREALDRALAAVRRADKERWFEDVEDAALPGYSSVIAKPMDFKTVDGRIKKGRYLQSNRGAAGMQHDLDVALINYLRYAEATGAAAGPRAAKARALSARLPTVFTAAAAGLDPAFLSEGATAVDDSLDDDSEPEAGEESEAVGGDGGGSGKRGRSGAGAGGGGGGGGGASS
ncbi:unnamed protein product, partial [Phaeothamnion confervicola]